MHMNRKRLDRIGVYIDMPWYMGQVGKRFSSAIEAADYYIGTGELLGDWPNPIFDPRFYRQHVSLSPEESCLDHFIFNRASGIRPCQFFDVDWYELRNPDCKKVGCGLLHYLMTGGKEYRDPSPQVDMIALSRDYGDMGDGAALVHALSIGKIDCSTNGAVTNSDAQLIRRQREFYRNISFALTSRVDKPVHGSNLLFVQCAKGAEFWSWFDVKKLRDWDMFLNCYVDNFDETKYADYVCIQDGTKFTGILNCWLNHKAIFDMYQAVLFIDDDIVFAFDDISKFFRKMEREGLDVAQPSLSKESFCAWPIFHNGSRDSVRRTNGVEIMMPALSKRARDIVLPYFVFSVSGFGLDLLMGKVALSKGLSIGIVDGVIAKHEKKIDPKSGSYYEFLRRSFINPQYELNRIIKIFRTDAEFLEI